MDGGPAEIMFEVQGLGLEKLRGKLVALAEQKRKTLSGVEVPVQVERSGYTHPRSSARKIGDCCTSRSSRFSFPIKGANQDNGL